MANIHGSKVVAMFSIFCLLLLSAPSKSDITAYSKSSMYFKSKCMYITNEPDCTSAGCYWWDESCNPYQQIAYSSGEYCLTLHKDVILCITNTTSFYLIIEGTIVNV